MSATESEIKEAVFAALRRIAPDADPTTLQPSDNIRAALEIDSYDFLQFLIALNKQLGVDIPESDYGKLQTIATLMQYLREHVH